jgi:hypothetical protein
MWYIRTHSGKLHISQSLYFQTFPGSFTGLTTGCVRLWSSGLRNCRRILQLWWNISIYSMKPSVLKSIRPGSKLYCYFCCYYYYYYYYYYYSILFLWDIIKSPKSWKLSYKSAYLYTHVFRFIQYFIFLTYYQFFILFITVSVCLLMALHVVSKQFNLIIIH